MSVYGEARAWLRAVALRRKAERDMHDEMNAHIEQAAERFVARGMSERDALHAARREFGSVTAIQEQSRDSRGGQWVDNFTTDVRYAFRYFARMPLITVTIVLTLTLGVGMSSAGFSLMNATLFRPAPGIPKNNSLVVVRGLQNLGSSRAEREMSLPEVQAYAAAPIFRISTAWRTFYGIADVLDGGSSVGQTRATYVLPNFFRTLGVPIVAGSDLLDATANDGNGTDLTAVIDYQFALNRFGGARESIGRTIRMNDVAITVVGVAAKKFGGVRAGSLARTLYMPVSAMRTVERARTLDALSNDSLVFSFVAQLRDGVPVEQALPVVQNIASRFTRTPAPQSSQRDMGADVVVLRTEDQVRPESRVREDLIGAMFLGMLNFLVLLVCTTTVSSLLIGSAVTRSHEIAVRLALGAGRQRVIRQLLTESAILALTGAALGLALLAVLTRVFEAQMTDVDLTPTWSTVGVTVLFAILTALMCGMSPALHATRHSLSETLKNSQTGTTSRSRLQRTFVVAQIAVAQPVLVVLAMFTVLIVGELRRESEIAVNGSMIVAEFDGNTSMHFPTAPAEMKSLQQRISQLPGVTQTIPWSEDRGGRTSVEPWHAAGDDAEKPAQGLSFEFRFVAPEFFAAMGIPLIAGRQFAPSDTSLGVTPIIVSSNFRSVVPGSSPLIGSRFCPMSCRNNDGKNKLLEIVGVVPAQPGDDDDGRTVKVFRQYRPRQPHAWLVRSTQSSVATIAAIRGIARTEAPHIPVERIATIAERNKDTRNLMLALSGGAAGGGLITLLLGCIGLYAVVALAVNQRRREIGIRIAMGARPSQIVSYFFKGGLRLSLVGLAIGLPLSAAAIRLIGNQVGLPKTNTVAITLFIASIVVVVASLATWLPSRRAAGVDPLVALRAE